MGIEKTEKLLQLRSQQGRTLRVVREHYLREDVPCNSALCLAACPPPDGRVGRLEADVTHYVVPDCLVAKDFLEILEFPQITGIILMQTVSHFVQHEGGRRTYKRLCDLVRDPRKHSTVFCNEFHKYAYQPRQAGQSQSDWQARNVYEGSVWFYNHLAGQKPIVIISEDSQMKSAYESETAGVFVLSVADYLEKFWPDLAEARELYESLKEALRQSKGKNKDYHGYDAQEVLEAGLKSGRLLQGRLQVNRHNAQQEAFVTPVGGSKKDGDVDGDIFIPGMMARNRAVHGDVVVVQLLPRSQWRGRSLAIHQNQSDSTTQQSAQDVDDSVDTSGLMPTGEVVGVLQRNWKDYIASFTENEAKSGRRSDKVLVIPFDWRIPKIRISTTQIDKLRDSRIIVRIDSWEADSQYPNGHFVRSLGHAGDLETEIAAILQQNDISITPFSDALVAELPVNTEEHPWTISTEEVAKRKDLRESHLIFSIDPKGCEDVDDTLSVKRLENGHIELGVHIADVTHFVKPGSLTDLEARSKSTTVYLADRRYDMLPGVLSADLCSLLGGVDRYAMSVIWELDEEYQVVDVWYGKTIIKSAYKLYYEIAQECADGAVPQELVDNIPELQDLRTGILMKRIVELRWAITTLMDIARHIKARRTHGGALQLEGVEVQVQIDKDNSSIRDLIPKQPLEIHETIAECMIFANHWVAKKICQCFPNQALLRHHPLPRQEHFDTLIKCAAAKGFEIETRDNKALADSLDRCIDPHDPMVNKLLRSLATQAMSNAEYFSTGSLPRDQFFHYGLALDYYTHFTSPIRRYADVLVHRLLMAALEQEEKGAVLGNTELSNVSQHINNKHRAAQYAQRESVQLFQTKYFEERSVADEDCIADAVIFQLRSNGLLVFVERYGIKGAVYLKSKDGQVLYLVEDFRPEWTGGSLLWTEQEITVDSLMGTHTYKVFDHVTVRISVQTSRAHASSLQLQLISNSPHISATSETVSAKQQKAEIIKMVKAGEEELAASASQVDSARLGPHYHHLQQQYKQTPEGTSLYNLFQDLQRSARLTRK